MAHRMTRSVIPATPGLDIGIGAALLVLNVIGWCMLDSSRRC